MNSIVAVLVLVLSSAAAVPVPDQEQGPVRGESPQSAYLGLPSGSDEIVSPIDISFSCAHRSLGYYADVGNECKIFHVCNPVLLSDGQVAMMQYSFVCPNGTLFDQQSLTCTAPPGTAPCVQAESFYYLNRHVGQVGAAGVPVASPPVQPELQRPAVVPEPKHETPVHQQQLAPPADSKPAGGDDSVVRPASYYGGKGN
ncbi:uncharacterized protein LOC119403158 [Rhipicephalus sanguineus]|uniref:Chitin-binding type-2 domain-containing protein n=1 Tax=Rhipicephalus sanguineus TaxID=34632 RepID=A0A9D4PF97_RHISA|nr:uncharacterized protein LOC119403158 [Rhipicephalus sanguineus]KAH7939102.1 hypothetical protein HPB52_005865 [Rhipicephalus sanguineus]